MVSGIAAFTTPTSQMVEGRNLPKQETKNITRLALSCARFKCWECNHLHFEEVEGACPNCGGDHAGSHHFSVFHEDIATFLTKVEQELEEIPLLRAEVMAMREELKIKHDKDYLHGPDSEIRTLRMENRALMALNTAYRLMLEDHKVLAKKEHDV